MLLQENIQKQEVPFQTQKTGTILSDRRNGNKNSCSSLLFNLRIFNMLFFLTGCNYFDNSI